MNTTTHTLSDTELDQVKIDLIYRLSGLLRYRKRKSDKLVLIYEDFNLARSLDTKFTERFFIDTITPAILAMDTNCTAHVVLNDECWFKFRKLPHEDEPARELHIRLPPWGNASSSQ